MSETRYCTSHQDTPTNLECSKCGRLICPRCLLHTPVGARCHECARLRRGPTFELTTPQLARAMLTSLALGIGLGLVYFLIDDPLLGRRALFPVLALGIIGYVIGEATSVSVNRKRGRTLKFVASGGVIVAFATIWYLISIDLSVMLGVLVGIYVAIGRL